MRYRFFLIFIAVFLVFGIASADATIETDVKSVYIPFGNTYTLDINVTNNYTDTDNITIFINSYGVNFISQFVSSPLGNVSIDRDRLNSTEYSPLENRIFSIELVAMNWQEENGNLTIKTFFDNCPGCDQVMNITVITQKPLDFPGMEIPAILLLLVISSLVFWRKVYLY